MTDSHQAIYDAVRSRISNGDIGNAVENVIRNENLGHYFQMACEAIKNSFAAYETPSAIYKPTLFIEGDKWCALYGDNLQDGVSGFGDSPALAMQDFDNNWNKILIMYKNHL